MGKKEPERKRERRTPTIPQVLPVFEPDAFGVEDCITPVVVLVVPSELVTTLVYVTRISDSAAK